MSPVVSLPVSCWTPCLPFGIFLVRGPFGAPGSLTMATSLPIKTYPHLDQFSEPNCFDSQTHMKELWGSLFAICDDLN